MTAEAPQSMLRRTVNRLADEVSAVVDKSPEAQTRRAIDKINAKIAQAKLKADQLIRLDPPILELVGYSMIVIAAEQMEAKRKYPGAHLDPMKDDARKARTAFITGHFTDESLRKAMLDQDHDRQMAAILVEYFYDGNPRRANRIFDNITYIEPRTKLEELFRAGQNPILTQG